jgi:hypothetical protein
MTKLQLRYQEMHLQFHLNDDLQPPKRPLRNTRNGKGNSRFRTLSHQNQVAFRANYRKSNCDLTEQIR